ncbi:PIG-L family deacetylase [Rhizobium glycinendophyticum]|nr:PIG-L family deacetylase [Rhizobium glycinendophyticum]
MLQPRDFHHCVIIMAHPDDEILWASSILATAKKVILCYGDTADAAVSRGRAALLRDFPLTSVIGLNIRESRSFLTTNWGRPIETAYGIQCGRDRDGYQRNFELARAAIAEHIAEGDLVVTHNPWGEYGHEEHVQVYRAVAVLKKERDFRLVVTGYASDRVLSFMEMNTPRLGGSITLPTNKSLALSLKQHYQKHDSWTWDDGYVWPDQELFYEITAEDAPLRPVRGTMASLPMNMLLIDGHLPLWRRVLRRFKRTLLVALDRVIRLQRGKR